MELWSALYGEEERRQEAQRRKMLSGPCAINLIPYNA